ncbi:alpha-L-rhamnosidase [Nonomuraea solani]|uniref:alpha-L-rhamnosidase n=1 Tax=Nonomuraea solani TaxID=1144553 RepID=A0A1H6DVA2_9ACTN|nr:alpha-L-rhamnosidase [Nonomuraea solani]SEG88683.1 alpha-L-rhamnosidase [Nonomuraea solani]
MTDTDSLHVIRTRTADLPDPLGIDDDRPHLSWHLASDRRGARQCAYQIQVASSGALLERGRADLWDTGRLAGPEQRVPYGGVPLRSRARAHWRVRCWGDEEHPGPWSVPARFELGLLDPAEWSAAWITHPCWSEAGAGPEPALPLFARDFSVAAPVARARLYITGVGVWTATINGLPVTDAVLEPPNTDFAQRVVYTTADVTALLRPGANAIGVRLGPGIAHVEDVPGRYTKFAGTRALPAALVQLELEAPDGTRTRVVSDPAWRTAPGPTLAAHWYGGEDHDARLESPGWDLPGHDRSGWRPVVTADRPAVRLTARACPPIRVIDELPTREVTRPAPGVLVFDVGTNIAGWPLLDVDLEAGRTIRIRPGEQLTPAGRVMQDEHTTGTPIADTYVTRAGRQRWHPSFTYHGFRYLEITGLPDDAAARCVRALVLRAANEPIGRLHTSHPLIDQIHRIVDRAVQGNMFSVLTDCPHREKLCWLEETHLVFDAVARGYDVAAYCRELVRNMAEAQTETGLVPNIAPEYVIFEDRFRDDPNWGSAIIMLPWLLYKEYGDLGTARRAYPAMRRYLEHLAGRATGDTLEHGLGDWIAIDESTPVAMAATWGYHRAADTLSKIATALGADGDARRYRALAARIAAAFHDRFFDPGTGRYGSGSQACDTFALDLGLAPELRQPALERLIDGIRAAGHHVTVGEIALPALLRVLSTAGRHDVVHELITQTTPPSYGHQVLAGATSLAEAWDGPTRGLSQNHFMLGAVETWLSRYVGGVDQADDSVGYRELVIAPVVRDELRSMTYTTRVPYGDVHVAWERHDDRFVLDVGVPVGATATVHVPTFGGRTPVCDDAALLPVRSRETAAEFHVGSGRWRFETAVGRSRHEGTSVVAGGGG